MGSFVHAQRAEVRLVMVTAPDGEHGERIAKELLGASLIACANLISGVKSVYKWKGQLCQDEEVIVLLKTTTHRLDRLTERIVELHPYDLPEIITLPVEGGLGPYLQWVVEETQGGEG